VRSPRTTAGLLVAVLVAALTWWVLADEDGPGAGDGSRQAATTEGSGPSEVPSPATSGPGATTSAPAPTSSAPPQTAPRATPSTTDLTLTLPTEPTVRTGDVDPETGLPLVTLEDLPPEAIDTLELIAEGGPFPYDRDGVTFENREGLLPDESVGYYSEYTVETPGSDDRGARRIVAGSSREYYYTDDHYDSFWRIAL
jgi:ribonuclease T1